MSDQDILNAAIARIQQRETQQPLFSKRPPVPHLKPSTQEQPPKLAPRAFVIRDCKFCGHKCHGYFALAQHLSEHVSEEQPGSYMDKKAREYAKHKDDALSLLYKEMVNKYQTKDERMDAMVWCDKFAHDSTMHCNGEYLDGGHPNAWVYHVLRSHTKQQMIDEFSKEDWEEFKAAYNKAIPALERAINLVQGRRTTR